MQSMAFIKYAKELITKINVGTSPMSTLEEDRAWANGVQKELNSLFGGLQNPTLPSAFNLRDTALANGFQVDPRVLQRLASFEHITG